MTTIPTLHLVVANRLRRDGLAAGSLFRVTSSASASYTIWRKRKDTALTVTR